MINEASTEDLSLRRDICVDPWTYLGIGGWGVSPCCYVPDLVKHEYLEGGPYSGEVQWNCEGFVKFREKMLAVGYKKACPVEMSCPICRGNGQTVKEQMDLLRKRFKNCPEIDEIEKSILSGKSKIDTQPLMVFLFIGRKCNTACPFCWSTYIPNVKNQLNDKNFEKLKPVFKNVRYTQFMGGDLFAHPDSYIKKVLDLPNPGTEIMTITNGIGMTPEKWEKWVRNGPLTRISVSLDTVDPEHYKTHRLKDLSIVKGNLEEIFRRDPNHGIFLGSLITTETLTDGPDLMRWGAKNGMKSVCFAPYRGPWLEENGLGRLDPCGDGWTPKTLDAAKRTLDEIGKVSRETGIGTWGYETVVNRILNFEKSGRKKGEIRFCVVNTEEKEDN